MLVRSRGLKFKCGLVLWGGGQLDYPGEVMLNLNEGLVVIVLYWLKRFSQQECVY